MTCFCVTSPKCPEHCTDVTEATPAEPDAGDVEALTEAELETLWTAIGGWDRGQTDGDLIDSTVERIVAARVAAAVEAERERIAQECERAARRTEGLATHAETAALRYAARIARESLHNASQG